MTRGRAWTREMEKRKVKKRSYITRDLHTPKYRHRVIENKKSDAVVEAYEALTMEDFIE